MRELKAKDLLSFAKILNKMGVLDIIKAIFSVEAGQHKELTGELIQAVIQNYDKAESELYAFIGELEGKPAEEIAELPLGEFITAIKAIFSEGFSFFTSAQKSVH